MKKLLLFILFTFSCFHTTNGIITRKAFNHKTTITYKWRTDKWNSPIPTSYIIPKRWAIFYRGEDGKERICEVSETVYNIMNVGEYFDCKYLGIEAELE